jgi:hypothetical protein
MSDFNQLLPLLNIIIGIGVIPLIRSINGLNSTVEKLCLRLDFIEKEAVTHQQRLDKDVAVLHTRIDKHVTEYHARVIK